MECRRRCRPARGRWTICGFWLPRHRALVIHGNYLDDEEIAFLGANCRRMAAVYCPRTHDWFAHDAVSRWKRCLRPA